MKERMRNKVESNKAKKEEENKMQNEILEPKMSEEEIIKLFSETNKDVNEKKSKKRNGKQNN
jgi:hypothetical protein